MASRQDGVPSKSAALAKERRLDTVSIHLSGLPVLRVPMLAALCCVLRCLSSLAARVQALDVEAFMEKAIAGLASPEN
jgi:hypothetical protein